MSRIIHKFKVAGPGWYTAMPIGAKPLSVGQQGDDIMCWAEVDSDQNLTEPRRLAVYATGQRMMDEPGQFVGTVQMTSGLVWHIFDYGPEPTP